MGQPSSLISDMSAGIGSASVKRVSIRGSRFRIREGSNETVLPGDTLRCVIVGAGPNTGVAKTFYKAYDSKADDKKPDCYSNDGIRPAADASDPQSQQCANCDHNQWGSKISDTGGRMKACADQKKLAIISADDTSSEPEVYLFTVPPTSLNNFKSYSSLLQSKSFHPELVVTEISFDTSTSHPKPVFKFGGFIDESMVDTIDGLVGTPFINEITGNVPQVAKIVEPVAPKPSPVKTKQESEAIAAPAPAYVPPPVVVEDAVYEDNYAPPTKKSSKGFGAAPAAPAPPKAPPPPAPAAVPSTSLTADIQSILADMQDDDDE
jgi:hypothetical protein